MDISINTNLPISIVDTIARDALGVAVSGISVADNTRIHLLIDSQVNQDMANDVLSNFGALSGNTDKTSMTEGDADPVVSCSDVLIASDTQIGYVVLWDGIEYASGTDAVVAGSVNLTLLSPIAGIYEIFIYRQTGNYASGSVTITVS